MITVIGIRFRTAGQVYFFDPAGISFAPGEHAIVETARGVEYGEVVLGNREVEEEKVVQPLKPVLRKAVPADEETEKKNREKEKEAYRICQEKIEKHGLEMKLVRAEYTFDNNKVLFYFTADGRVDFRELVKDLASVFRTRIELRQIGVRDETKMLGGIGMCGRPLCCHAYLSDFIPVSIRMAKEQSLSLNPGKISGVCGRLMCCLKYEEETYEYLNSKLPGIGDTVTAEDGVRGEVQSVNVLRQTVKVIVSTDQDEKELHEYRVDQLRTRVRRQKGRGNERTAEEIEAEKIFAEDEENAVEARKNQERHRNRKPRNGEENTERAQKNGENGGERREYRQGRRGEDGSRNEGEGRKDRGERRRNGGEPRKNDGETRKMNGENREEGAEEKQLKEGKEGRPRRRRRRGEHRGEGEHHEDRENRRAEGAPGANHES